MSTDKKVGQDVGRRAPVSPVLQKYFTGKKQCLPGNFKNLGAYVSNC